MKILRLMLVTAALGFGFAALGCNRAPSAAERARMYAQMSDAELGLTPTQAAGRRLYNQHCLVCHEAYSPTDRNGPSLAGLYRKKFMVSGQPVNDERVRDIIVLGRSKMPAFGGQLSDDQIAAVVSYMKTL